MQSVYTDPKIFRRQQWQQIWPTSCLAVIAIIQMLLTFIILGFETWSMLLNVKYAFLFVGYIAAFFFTITWISTFTVVCCNRDSRGCATHALVENILSVIASSILVYYDVRFLREPWTCLWPGYICSDIYWNFTGSVWWNNSYFDIPDAKLIAIKVQLSCAAVMLALCVLFILIYIYTSLKVRTRLTTVNPQGTIELRRQQQLPPPTIPAWSAQPPGWPTPSNFEK